MLVKKFVIQKFLPFFKSTVKFLFWLKILNNSYKIYFANKVATCNPRLSRKYIEKKIQNYCLKEGKVPLTNKNFWEHIKSSSSFISPKLDNVLASYLPYIPGSKTQIFANNFFSANYSLRTPLSVQTSIVDSSGNILYSQNSIIEAYSQSLIDIPILKLKTDEKIFFVFIQCFNPRLKKDHGGHNGYYRVHGFYSKKFQSSESYSVVHSMPYSEDQCLIFEDLSPSVSSRGFLPKKMQPQFETVLVDYFFNDLNPNPIKQDKGNLLRLQTNFKNKGYVVLKNLENEVKGIWHDGPDHEKKYIMEQNTELLSGITGFYVPSFEDNAPFLLFDKSSLGFDDSCLVEVKAEFNELIVTEKIQYKGQPMLVDSAELFEKYSPTGSFSIQIKFIGIAKQKLDPLMVQLIMRDGKNMLGDGVHSGSGFTKKRPFGVKPGGMVVWGPYFKKSNNLNWDYSLHHSYLEGDSKTDILKIKIFTDMGYEFIHNIDSLPATKNFHISCSQLDDITGFKKKVISTASIQFECRSSTIYGCFYVFDKLSGMTGTDHLTGG